MIFLSRKALILITVFTGVETTILTVWLAVIDQPIIAALVLFLGLEIEHILAGISNKI